MKLINLIFLFFLASCSSSSQHVCEIDAVLVDFLNTEIPYSIDKENVDLTEVFEGNQIAYLGFIGENKKKIDFYITYIERDPKNHLRYFVEGKTKIYSEKSKFFEGEFFKIIMDPKDWVAIQVMSVVAAVVPPPPTDESSANVAMAFQAGLMVGAIAMSKKGMNATVAVGGIIPRAVTGAKNEVIPHFPMGAGFHVAFKAIKKSEGHVQLGSLFVNVFRNKPFNI